MKFQRANAYFELEMFEEALVDVDVCLKFNPKQSTYQLMKGKCLFHLKRYEEAQKWISKVNTSSIILFDGLLYQARLSMATAEFDQAITQFQELLKKTAEPEVKSELYQYIGSCYLALGENKLAEASFSLAR